MLYSDKDLERLREQDVFRCLKMLCGLGCISDVENMISTVQLEDGTEWVVTMKKVGSRKKRKTIAEDTTPIVPTIHDPITPNN